MRRLIRKIYKLIPFKKPFYEVLKVVWQPKENIYKHLHFKGIINVKVENKYSFKIHHMGHHIENELFWSGIENGFEKLSLSLWIKLSKKANVIFDVGAYSGLYSLTSACINPNSRIYAFEPMEHNFNLLSNNIKINDYTNIVPVKKACSNFSGEAIVYTEKNTTLTTSVTVNKSLFSEDKELDIVPIETIKLYDYFEKEGLNQLDLIKIDVETHEYEVLKGMEDLIKKYTPTFLIEVLDDDVAKNIELMIGGLGYMYFDIDEIDKIQRVNSIKKSSYYNYLICQENVAQELNLI